MASENAFNIKDKVFAKLKYCPAWPAIITNIQDENALQPRRYMIHFYGTYEKALCLPEQLFLYEKHKFELGKPKKISKLKLEKFTKAIEEIENDLVLSTDDTNIVTTPKNIVQKSKLGVKKKFNKLSMSTGKGLDTPKINKRVFKRTKIKSPVPKLKKNVRYSIYTEFSQNLQPSVKLEIIPKTILDKYLEKYNKQQKPETSINDSADATSYYTNYESMSTNEPTIKPSNDLLESSQTAKSALKIKEELTSFFTSISDEQETFNKYNSSSVGFISPSSLRVKHEHTNNQAKPKRSKKKLNKNISVGSRNNNAENNKTDPSEMDCVTKQIYSKEKNDSKGAIQLEFTKTNPDSSKNNEFDNNKIDDASTEKKSSYQENDVKITKYSRRATLRKKIQNPRNIAESIECTINNNEAEQKCKNRNIYSDEKINDASYKETIIDLKLHCAGSSTTTKCLLPKKNVKTKDETSKIKNVTFETLSDQIEILPVSDQIESPLSSQGFIVDDAGSEIRMQRAQPKKDDSDSRIKNLLKIVNLMDNIYKLRSALSINNPDYEVAIQSLLQIEKNDLTAFAWKKYPDIVDTIYLVSHYTGHSNIQSVPQREIIINAAKIRKMAQAILEKIGLLFNVSNMKSFKSVFNKEVEEFQEKFKYLDFDTILQATSEDQLMEMHT